jgi:hypothetical protein
MMGKQGISLPQNPKGIPTDHDQRGLAAPDNKGNAIPRPGLVPTAQSKVEARKLCG